jgi:hypothetical protein
MNTHDLALATGGAIGSAVAIFHGALTQRRMVEPFLQIAAERLPRTIRRLVAALLHFSTFNWFLSGLALVIAAFALGREAKLAIGLLAGSSYLYGALANLWATRGRHIGWVLYVAALALIAYGLAAPGT